MALSTDRNCAKSLYIYDKRMYIDRDLWNLYILRRSLGIIINILYFCFYSFTTFFCIRRYVVEPCKIYGGVPFKPVANGKCTSCGLCAKECPAGAIPLDNPKMTDKDKCISCMHCVAVCPKKARNYSKLVSFIAGLKMKKVCSGRKENKLYL